jgi:chemotaxis methyl-accepting protein methylase
MVLERYLPPTSNFQILATDIDSQVLQKASSAVYPASRIREQVPEDYHSRAIDFGKSGIEYWARIKPHLKDRVSFATHNLIDDSLPRDSSFDIIFLRNVLIYFAPETIQFVVEKLYRATKPGGLLFISHSESLNAIETSWTSVAPSIYKK